MTPVHLDMWSVEFEQDAGHRAPETLARVLVGVVTGHPRKPDGTRIQTSRITEARGRLITTSSGTVYRLGRIHPKYLAFLRRSGRTYDRVNPVRIIDARAELAS